MKTIEEFIADHIIDRYQSGKEDGDIFNGEIESEQGLLVVQAKVTTTIKEGLKSGDYDTPNDPDEATFEVEIVDIYREKHYLKQDGPLPLYIFIDTVNETAIKFYKEDIKFDFDIDIEWIVKWSLINNYQYCTRQELSEFYAEQTKELNFIAKEI